MLVCTKQLTLPVHPMRMAGVVVGCTRKDESTCESARHIWLGTSREDVLILLHILVSLHMDSLYQSVT
jgi:hypothetical protein